MTKPVTTEIAESDGRLIYVSEDVARTPPEGIINHLKDRWWTVHPSQGLVFWKSTTSPQCNSNKLIAERLAARYPWAKVEFRSSVFVPVNIGDYL